MVKSRAASSDSKSREATADTPEMPSLPVEAEDAVTETKEMESQDRTTVDGLSQAETQPGVLQV